jgi:hypothetical protein
MAAFDAARFQALFEEVWDQLYRLHTNWTLYVSLFESMETVELLRASALVTFGALHSLLIEAIFLGTHPTARRWYVSGPSNGLDRNVALLSVSCLRSMRPAG